MHIELITYFDFFKKYENLYINVRELLNLLDLSKINLDRFRKKFILKYILNRYLSIINNKLNYIIKNYIESSTASQYFKYL